jgi:hypothetical protein
MGTKTVKKKFHHYAAITLAALLGSTHLLALSREQDLVVNTVYNGNWDLWPLDTRWRVTYCVSSAFGSSHGTAVKALDEAIQDWQKNADMHYEHIPALDSDCNPGNNRVRFHVLPTQGQDYIMSAFFPSWYPQDRNLMVNTSLAFNDGYTALVGYFRHEIGHTLGFRHEHIQVDGRCKENGTWQPLTAYDSASVMHYPHCPRGTGNLYNLVLTDADRVGARKAYPITEYEPPYCESNPCTPDGTPL